MQTNRNQATLVRNYKELVRLMTDPNIQVQDVIPVHTKMVLVTHRHFDTVAPVSPNLSLVISAITTSHARLKLYNYLEQLPSESILYFDTGKFSFM